MASHKNPERRADTLPRPVAMKTNRHDSLANIAVFTFALAALAPRATRADDTPQPLPFVQNWSDVSLITKDNDWSRVPGFMGYRGDKLATKPGVNPQTIEDAGTTTPVSDLA